MLTEAESEVKEAEKSLIVKVKITQSIALTGLNSNSLFFVNGEIKPKEESLKSGSLKIEENEKKTGQ